MVPVTDRLENHVLLYLTAVSPLLPGLPTFRWNYVSSKLLELRRVILNRIGWTAC